jgi:hypothetical protein
VLRFDRRCVEELAGTGTLTAGVTTIGPALYVVEVWHVVRVVDELGSPVTETHVGTDLDIAVVPQVPDVRAAMGQLVTLHLEDGRSVTGVFTGNRLLASGGFTRPS